jgi:hypothetical protein
MLTEKMLPGPHRFLFLLCSEKERGVWPKAEVFQLPG